MGGVLRPTRQMENFRQALYDCNLHAVPVIRPFFTWSRGKGSNMILERLDRGVATDSWFAMFPTVCETHLVAPISDHAPLLFHLSNKQWKMRGNKKSFRFENMWMRHEGCAEVIKEGWQHERISNIEELAKGLENCGKLLNRWNKEVFGNIQVRLRQKKKRWKSC